MTWTDDSKTRRRVLARVRAEAHAAERGSAAYPASPTAIRTYRIYFRDARNVVAQFHEVGLASDEDAREHALMMLNEQTIYSDAKVWERRGSFARCARANKSGKIGRTSGGTEARPASSRLEPSL